MTTPQFVVGQRVRLLEDNYDPNYGTAGWEGIVREYHADTDWADVRFAAEDGTYHGTWWIADATRRLALITTIPVYDAHPKGNE